MVDHGNDDDLVGIRNVDDVVPKGLEPRFSNATFDDPPGVRQRDDGVHRRDEVLLEPIAESLALFIEIRDGFFDLGSPVSEKSCASILARAQSRKDFFRRDAGEAARFVLSVTAFRFLCPKPIRFFLGKVVQTVEELTRKLRSRGDR